jgi:DNA primase
MPGVDFDILRREITMQQVLDLLGFQAIARRGQQLRGPCPIHGSTSPGSRSFSVHLESGRYQCFRCGSKGNQLELWAEARRLRIYEAAIDLCQALGREVPWIRPL